MIGRVKIIILVCFMVFMCPFLARGQMGDFSPPPKMVPADSGYLEYANNKWKISITRYTVSDGGSFGSSYQVEVIADFDTNVEIKKDINGFTRLYAPAQIKGVVSFYHQPTRSCEGITRSVNYSTTGRVDMQMMDDGSLSMVLSLQIFDLSIPSYFPFPTKPFKVDCSAYNETDRKYNYWTEERTSLYWINPFLIIILKPGNYAETGDLKESHLRRTWQIKIEPVGPPLPCLNNCDDNNACTIDKCKIGIGCMHTPVPDGTPCPGIGDNRCRPKPSCMNGLCSPRPPRNGMFDFDPHDCYKNECTNGYEAQIPDDTEIPPQALSHVPCEKQICIAGSIQTVGDPADTPPQEPGNCRKETCNQYGVWYGVIDDSDAPADDPYDCLRYYCRNGEVMAPVPNDTEIPQPGPDGRPRVCRGGTPVE